MIKLQFYLITWYAREQNKDSLIASKVNGDSTIATTSKMQGLYALVRLFNDIYSYIRSFYIFIGGKKLSTFIELLEGLLED